MKLLQRFHEAFAYDYKPKFLFYTVALGTWTVGWTVLTAVDHGVQHPSFMIGAFNSVLALIMAVSICTAQARAYRNPGSQDPEGIYSGDPHLERYFTPMLMLLAVCAFILYKMAEVIPVA